MSSNMHPVSDTTKEESNFDHYSDGFDDFKDSDFGSDDLVSGDYDDADADADADAFLEEIKDDVNDPLKFKKQRNFQILSTAEIRQRMERDVTEVSTVVSVSKVEASILLRHYNWSSSRVIEAWFADEPGVREKVGLLEKPAIATDAHPNKRKIITCGICFESYTDDKTIDVACGHNFCEICWSTYIPTSINNDGIGCLMLRCPEPSCRAAIGQDMIDSLASEEDRNKYSDFLVKSYVEENRMIKWCPGAGCVYAVELFGDDGSFDVTCHCFASFCWNCNEDSHRPVDCDTVNKWMLKNSSESENVNYILAYCKPCPKCKRSIEKNGGCMHMHCKACGHHFCWLCLGPNYSHSCNVYPDPANSGSNANNPEAMKQKMAKESLEKYMHYFERWDANRKSKLKALADHHRVKNEELEKLSELQDIPEANLDFITKAWLQVAECRRALEWSYAYGYYLSDEEPTMKRFFEYLQGEAESTLEKLHNCVENEVKGFLDIDGISKDKFSEFRKKLVGLTVVTGNYFEKLVRALEKGLSVINSQDYWNCDRCTYANPVSLKQCQMCVLASDG